MVTAAFTFKVPLLSSHPTPFSGDTNFRAAEFRLVVFRPFVGEVLIGRIMAATHKGIRVSLEFFDDIFIPDNLLFENAILYLSPFRFRYRKAYFG